MTPAKGHATIANMSELLFSQTFPTGKTLELRQGDLTEEAVDAMVNATNAQLLHGGGVAGLIARKAGPELAQECRAWIARHGLVTHTQPAHTTGGNLPCRFVIHAVGPSWGSGQEDERLASAVVGVLKRAEELGLESLAMPAISTGIFGFPVKRAARLILVTLNQQLAKPGLASLRLVRLVLFTPESVQAFSQVFTDLFPSVPAAYDHLHP